MQVAYSSMNPMSTPTDTDEMLSMLRWYTANGVDLAISETPQNRFAEVSKAPAGTNVPSAPAIAKQNPAANPVHPAAAPAASSQSGAGNPSQVTDNDIDGAREIAAACQTMEQLRDAYAAFDGCALKMRATQLVFADGNPEADIMLIGEAPGENEDLQGKPFVGRAGHLLDKMLGAIGLDRDKVFIVNSTPWRPPGNRKPTPIELAACRPFLDRQVQLAAPKLILALGAIATENLFDQKVAIARVRGTWKKVDFGSDPLPVLATLHPAYLLRQPKQKRGAWQDLLALKHAIDALNDNPTV